MRVIVYGGSGALGSKIVDHFVGLQWQVLSIDMRAQPAAQHNIVLAATAPDSGLPTSVEHHASYIKKEIDSIDGGKWNAIICVAGGWAGGNAADPGFLKSAQLMWRQSVESSTITAYIAAHCLATNGFVALTGAKAALQGTPGMIGYGMAKAAVHQLTKSLGAAGSGSGLPAGSRVLCVLPVTLDTPANRSAMPKADFTSWTPLSALAEQYAKWVAGNDTSQPSGSLVEVQTKDSVTTFSAVQ